MNKKQITSLQHPTVKHLMKLRQNRDYREDHHQVVVSGIKLVHELIKDGFAIKTLVAKNESLIPHGNKVDEVMVASEEIIKKITGLQAPDGLIAEIAKPKPSSLSGVQRLLVCDGLGDPGNLGTLLRTALALGWDGAFLINPICDVYNDKALRAAKGATFRLPLREGSWDDLRQLTSENKLKLWVADLKGDSVQEAVKQKSSGGIALVMSHEAHGVSEQAATHCQAVTIPMSGKIESLNVAIAGGIIMYELGKR